MKLAEALILRADLQRKIDQITARILPNLIVQGQKSPQENPDALLAKLRDAIGQFEAIVARINKTNVVTNLPDGRTLMEGLAQRDALKMLQVKLRQIRDAATLRNHGYSEMRTTIKFTALQSEIDQVGRRFREIDTDVQRLNWDTELME
jgi:hypothetical protein